MKYPIHKDFRLARFVKMPLHKWLLPFANAFLNIIKKSRSKVKVTKLKNIDSPCPLYLFEPKELNTSNTIVYYHGGGFMVEAGPSHYKMLAEYVTKANCKVVFVKYPLAVNNNLDETIEKSYQSYLSIIRNSEALGINLETIGIAGDSAGGFITAAVCLKAKKNNIKPKFQMLIYPVIDYKMSTASSQDFINTPFWNTKYNKIMWKWCLPKTNIEAFDLINSDTSNLVDTYVETAEFDPLRDEGILYAEKLKHDNNVILNNTKQTIHGYDFFIKSEIVKANIEQRVQFLKDEFTR